MKVFNPLPLIDQVEESTLVDEAYGEWSSAESYAEGDKRIFQGRIYQALSGMGGSGWPERFSVTHKDFFRVAMNYARDTLMVTNNEGGVRPLDLATKTLGTILPTPPGAVGYESGAFNPSGSLYAGIVSTSDDVKVLAIWNTSTSTIEHVITVDDRTHGVSAFGTCVAFSANGTYVAVSNAIQAAEPYFRVKIYNTSDWSLYHAVEEGSDFGIWTHLGGMAFSNSESPNLLYVGGKYSAESGVYVVDVAAKTHRLGFDTPTNLQSSHISVNPVDGRVAFAYIPDGTAGYCAVASSSLSNVVNVIDSYPHGITWSSDGKELAITGNDGGRYEAAGLTKIDDLPIFSSPAYFDSDTKIIGTRNSKSLEVYDPTIYTPSLYTAAMVGADNAFWLDLGASNTERMIDEAGGTYSVGTETIDATTYRVGASPSTMTGIAITFSIPSRSNTLLLLGVIADKCDIQISSDGSAFLGTRASHLDGSTVCLHNLPITYQGTIRIALHRETGQASIDNVLIGNGIYIGDALYGATVEEIDHSRIVEDENYGGMELQKRAWAAKADMQIRVPVNESTQVFSTITSLRATKCVWVTTDADAYGALTIYGVRRRWQQEYESYNNTIARLTIRGVAVPDDASSRYVNRDYDVFLPAAELLYDIAATGVISSDITLTRASVGTYWDDAGVLQTASANTARIDHDPYVHSRLGLLIEEPRTNYVYPSEPDASTLPTVVSGKGIASIVTEINPVAGNGTVWKLDNSGNDRTTVYEWDGLPADVSAHSIAALVKCEAGSSCRLQIDPDDPSEPCWRTDWRLVAHENTAPASESSKLQITLPADSVIYVTALDYQDGATITSHIPTTTGASARASETVTVGGSHFTDAYTEANTMIARYASAGVLGEKSAELESEFVLSDYVGSRGAITRDHLDYWVLVQSEMEPAAWPLFSQRTDVITQDYSPLMTKDSQFFGVAYV